ncbi:hypothetical protein PHAVU_008G146200 [Phaseolus vulgaris]|uniref:Trichome birefringence-like C-terminal domain-containing protein n=1 Tax=Phaseolus vulgaris TaxID=3885 RepID=V7B8M9_PHAVU|nr:hypothetical protein PHAVU_008G146200g [Phaseolus vulgaris]ESW12836.1 hypothetical protein PHAVU_008G146200g [Phaseolus vulgaris]
MIPLGIMKPSRGKLPLPIIIITTCVLVFVAILYAERLSFLSSKSIFKFKPCPRQITKPKSILAGDKKLQGKKLLFVGDSLQRNQWESFLCLVEWVIPHKHKSMRLAHSVFTAKMQFYICFCCCFPIRIEVSLQ